ncbi:MAG TPA: MotA/TolQ/ExbB proton channel family protein [Oligoflexia bacterium]|nr:MotA/TolQ/ExbB proton channel family protein [Oligoflexia bacterium]HMP48771.1 MotA/TolQ/ExbB proton channel family protein [Oligoflexia bacterium]
MKSIIRHPNLTVSPLTGAITGLVTVTLLLSADIPFIDPASLILVMGGTLTAGIVAFEYQLITKAIREAVSVKSLRPFTLTERVHFFAETSQILRSKGNIALEQIASEQNDPLLRKGLQLVADGYPESEIRYALSLDIRILKDQRRTSVDVLNFLASVAPAAGLIGTVIGLILMLSNIGSSSELGNGMSLALLTTLYGAILSYLVLQPLATRLDKSSQNIELLHNLTLEGVMTLSKGVNPILVQEHLEAFAA